MSRKQAIFGQPAVYNATPPTLIDGDSSALNVDSSGYLRVNVTAGGSGGTYNATPPTYTDGQATANQSDVNGNQKVTLATGIAGEDLPNDVLKTEQRFGYKNITTQATTIVKTGVGFLHAINFNVPLASGVTTIYDGVDTGGIKIGTITFPVALLSDVSTYLYDVAFSVGLTIVTSGATQDITVSYR